MLTSTPAARLVPLWALCHYHRNAQQGWCDSGAGAKPAPAFKQQRSTYLPFAVFINAQASVTAAFGSAPPSSTLVIASPNGPQ